MNEEAKLVLERLIRELKQVQSDLDWESDESGYLGEALCAIAMALGRHQP